MLSALQDGGERSKVLLARLAEQPKSPAIIGVAELLCQQGRHAEAIARLRAMADYYDDSYRFHLVLARAHRDSGDFERAKQHYEKACQLAPQNEVAMKELIALVAFPETLKKSAPATSAEPQKPAPPQASEPDVPREFKLDREKLSKVLGGSASAPDAPPALELKSEPAAEPSSAALEEFRKADALLEQTPDLDALAREALGLSAAPAMNAPVPSEPNVSATETTSTQSAPSDEPPAIKLDRDKLAQAFAGLRQDSPAPPDVAPAADDAAPEKKNERAEPEPAAPPREQPLSFEEELMALQMQGGDLDAFLAQKDAPSRLSDQNDLDALAREIMNAQIPKVVETNDPTPIAEQRQPFSDDEEIKIPTRQLAKIFQSQGAYAKAIKVYEMLAEREPENASLYEILISGLREKMQSESP